MITLIIVLPSGKRVHWGEYNTVTDAARRGQQLLSNPLVRDYVIVDPAEGILFPQRPAARQVLPPQPQYEG